MLPAAAALAAQRALEPRAATCMTRVVHMNVCRERGAGTPWMLPPTTQSVPSTLKRRPAVWAGRGQALAATGLHPGADANKVEAVAAAQGLGALVGQHLQAHAALLLHLLHLAFFVLRRVLLRALLCNLALQEQCAT
jgi:hypothetical protein